MKPGSQPLDCYVPILYLFYIQEEITSYYLRFCLTPDRTEDFHKVGNEGQATEGHVTV
jgi:hypothetical protein